MSVSAYKVNIYVANLARVSTGPQTLYGSFEFGILLVCFYEYLKPYLLFNMASLLNLFLT